MGEEVDGVGDVEAAVVVAVARVVAGAGSTAEEDFELEDGIADIDAAIAVAVAALEEGLFAVVEDAIAISIATIHTRRPTAAAGSSATMRRAIGEMSRCKASESEAQWAVASVATVAGTCRCCCECDSAGEWVARRVSAATKQSTSRCLGAGKVKRV